MKDGVLYVLTSHFWDKGPVNTKYLKEWAVSLFIHVVVDIKKTHSFAAYFVPITLPILKYWSDSITIFEVFLGDLLIFGLTWFPLHSFQNKLERF